MQLPFYQYLLLDFVVNTCKYLSAYTLIPKGRNLVTGMWLVQGWHYPAQNVEKRQLTLMKESIQDESRILEFLKRWFVQKSIAQGLRKVLTADCT